MTFILLDDIPTTEAFPEVLRWSPALLGSANPEMIQVSIYVHTPCAQAEYIVVAWDKALQVLVTKRAWYKPVDLI